MQNDPASQLPASLKSISSLSLPQVSAIFGFFVWVASTFLPIGDSPETSLIEIVFLFAAMVLVPLGVGLVKPTDPNRELAKLYRLAVGLQPLGALAVLISFLLPKGWTAGTISLVWLVVDLLLALIAFWRFALRGLTTLEELSVDAALVYPTIGGVSLLLYQLDVQPFGFGATIILLTAVHFHFAGFAAPLIAAMTSRFLRHVSPRSIWLQLALLLIVGSMPIVALGITLSPPLALVGALTISVGILLLSVFTVTQVLPLIESIAVRILLGTSALATVPAMVLACAYAYSLVTKTVIINIPTMAVTHGLLNAFGFVACGLIAWSLIRTD